MHIGYTFSIISNLFNSDKPYARIIENVRTKYIIFGEALRIMVKKFQRNLRETIQKALKQPLQHVDFQNCFGVHTPGLKLFLPKKCA